jgi:Thiamine-binding protein
MRGEVSLLISAQVSLYPLRQTQLSPAIQAVGEALREAGLQPQVGPMSTLVIGEAEVLFWSLGGQSALGGAGEAPLTGPGLRLLDEGASNYGTARRGATLAASALGQHALSRRPVAAAGPHCRRGCARPSSRAGSAFYSCARRPIRSEPQDLPQVEALEQKGTPNEGAVAGQVADDFPPVPLLQGMMAIHPAACAIRFSRSLHHALVRRLGCDPL